MAQWSDGRSASGPEPPGDPNALASLIRDAEGEDVAVSIRFIEQLEGISTGG